MANNFVNFGSEYNYIATSQANSGELNVKNGFIGVNNNTVTAEEIADTDRPSELKKVVMSLNGQYDLALHAGDTPSAGDIAYQDGTVATEITTSNASGVKVGTFEGTYDSSTARIYLNKFFG